MRTRLIRIGAVARRQAELSLRHPALLGLVIAATFATMAVNPAAMIPSGDAAVEGTRPYANSRFALAQVFSLSGLLFYTFLVCVFVAGALESDRETRVEPLIRATPISDSDRALARFTGLMAMLGGAIVLHVAIAAAWYEFGYVFGATAVRGPFHAASYALPALLFLAPGVLFCAGLSFWLAERARSPYAAYAMATSLFVVTLGLLIPRPALESALLAQLGDLASGALDIWGTSWLSTLVFTGDRSIAFYNEAALPLDFAFVLNRAFVVILPLFLVWRASRRPSATSARGQPAPSTTVEPSGQVPAAVIEPTAITPAPSLVRSLDELTRFHLRRSLTRPAFLLLIGFCALSSLDGASNLRGPFEAPPVLGAGLLAVSLLESTVSLGCLLLLLHCVFSLETARSTRFDALLRTLPLAPASILLGPYLSGVALVLINQAASVGVCALLLLQAGHDWSFGPFLLIFGAALLPTYAFFGAFVMLLWVVFRSGPVALLGGLATLAATFIAGLRNELTWTNNWALFSALQWTDIGLFEATASSLLLNRLAVSVAALLSFLLAVILYRRTDWDRAQTNRASASRLLRATAALAGLVLIGVEFRLERHVREGVNGTVTRERDLQYRERNAARWGGKPTPTLEHVDASVRLEPRTSGLSVDGCYRIRNDSGAATTRLAFTLGPSFGPVTWRVDGARISVEERSGLAVLVPAKPVESGQISSVCFRYDAVVPRGSTRNGESLSAFILPSSVRLDTLGRDFLPTPGFRSEIGNDVSGSTALSPDESDVDREFWRAELPPVSGPVRPFTASLQIDAPRDLQIASVGQRVDERREGDRAITRWVTDQPVRWLSLVGGRWAVERRGDTSVWYHLAHARNAAEIADTAAAARAFYSAWFAPYPWRDLRIAEYANHETRAQSFPTLVSMSEVMGWNSRSAPGERFPSIVTAHEVAHQWWGHLITPGKGPGADALIEGLAHYATLALLGAHHGESERMAFARTVESRFLDTRRVDGERPIASIEIPRSNAESSAMQEKGGLAFWVQEELGADAMRNGLSGFIDAFRNSRDHAALPDLLEILRARAKDVARFDRLSNEWFHGVGLPEFRVSGVVARSAPEGVSVSAVIENIGGASAPVEIVLIDETDPGVERRCGEAARPFLAPGSSTTVELSGPCAKARIVVDPRVHVLQQNRARAQGAIPKGFS